MAQGRWKQLWKDVKLQKSREKQPHNLSMGLGFQPCHRGGRPVIEPFGVLQRRLGDLLSNKKSFDIRRKGKNVEVVFQKPKIHGTTKTCGILLLYLFWDVKVGSLLWLCSLDDPFIGTCASKTPSLEVDSFPPAALFLSEIYRFRVGWPWFNDVQCISISSLYWIRILLRRSSNMPWKVLARIFGTYVCTVLYCNLMSCHVM